MHLHEVDIHITKPEPKWGEFEMATVKGSTIVDAIPRYDDLGDVPQRVELEVGGGD